MKKLLESVLKEDKITESSNDDIWVLARELEKKDVIYFIRKSPDKVVSWLLVPVEKRGKIKNYAVSSGTRGYTIYEEVDGKYLLHRDYLTLDEVVRRERLKIC